jgi:small subunit ribosomal protein S21
MIIIKIEKNISIEKALKLYKSKIIKTRQQSELNNRKYFIKKSVKNRESLKKAIYVQKKFKSIKD